MTGVKHTLNAANLSSVGHMHGADNISSIGLTTGLPAQVLATLRHSQALEDLLDEWMEDLLDER